MFFSHMAQNFAKKLDLTVSIQSTKLKIYGKIELRIRVLI